MQRPVPLVPSCSLRGGATWHPAVPIRGQQSHHRYRRVRLRTSRPTRSALEGRGGAPKTRTRSITPTQDLCQPAGAHKSARADRRPRGRQVTSKAAQQVLRHERRNRHGQHADREHLRDGGARLRPGEVAEKRRVGCGEKTVHAHHEDHWQRVPREFEAHRAVQKAARWVGHTPPVLLAGAAQDWTRPALPFAWQASRMWRSWSSQNFTMTERQQAVGV